MGRRERELDPADGPVVRFALELRKLRREAAPLTYREMAARAHYSATTLAEAAAGDRLPSLPVTLAYVRACGGDEAHWERRWAEAGEEVTGERLAADSDPASAPYRGLARFETGDSDLFFGRDRAVAQLAALVGEKPFTVLSGPSGSGKSSMLRAGLIPRLRHLTGTADRPSVIRVLTPGPRPATAHAPLLAPGATNDGRALLIVDQFEELFTLCTDASERSRFIGGLLDAVRPERGGRVLIAVRADFYGHLAQDRRLAEAAGDSTLLLGPMTEDELREAITRPAATQGLLVERSLTARIIEELSEQPGSLPLMSHALLETWHRRHGRTLTESAYGAAGGLAGAISRTAEECYGRLTPMQRETAQRVLLRLVAPGFGTQDTRRPVIRSELGLAADRNAGEGGHGEDVAVVLEHLGRARLITLGHDSVDLAHEALLTAWPRLRGWIDEDRERLRLHRRLTEAATGWQDLGRDPGALYRGVRLSTAQAHFGTRSGESGELSPLEGRFLAASTRAAARRVRLRRVRGGALSTLLVLALLAGLVAWQQSRLGDRRRIEDEARRVAGVAESLRLSDPVTSMRLALAAWNAADLPETRSALLSASTQPEQGLFTDPDTDSATMRHLSDDGRTLLSLGSRNVVEWDVRTGRERRHLPGLGEALDLVAPMRGGGLSVPQFLKGDPFEVRVGMRDLVTGRTGRALSTAASGGVATSPSGRLLITYEKAPDPAGEGRRQRAVVRDATTGETLLTLPPRPWREPRADEGFAPAASGALDARRSSEGRGLVLVQEVNVSPDDSLLAQCLPGEPVQLWDLDRRRRVATPWAPTTSRVQCLNEAVQFTPDSRGLVLVDDDGVRMWDIGTGRGQRLAEHQGLVEARLSPDGRFLAATDGEELLLWRTDDPGGEPVFRYGLEGAEAAQLRFDLAAGTLSYLAGSPLNFGWGSAVRTVDIGRVLAADWQRSPALNAEFSPSGTLLAVARQGEGDRAGFRLRELGSGGGWTDLPGLPCPAPTDQSPGCMQFLAFSPDNRTLAYGTETISAVAHPTPPLRVNFWGVSRHRVTGTADLVMPERTHPVELSTIAYTPDGRSLLLVEPPALGWTHLWDLRRRDMVRSWPGAQGHAVAIAPDGSRFVTSDGQVREPSDDRPPAGAGSIESTGPLAFSPDGAVLAAGDSTGRVVLWDGQVRERLGELRRVGPEAPRGVTALAFSPDSRLLAVGGGNGAVQLWDLASRTPLGSPLPTAGDSVMALSFGADGTTLRVSGRHVDLASYEIAPRTAATTVCRRADGALAETAWREFFADVPFTAGCPAA
ncbi:MULTISPECIES: hypothetical protein [unclassified Streptomyces]|uniref:nSTAND1 domain-containing NTPase n=1 Tax=unclassified Streptomyces TaxID=2593676 RepID=UPI00037CD3D5|nr:MULTISPECIES: hypothetical protein [unclassified Streptomyces]MYY05066.1 hypothetical protein [Streptomyces sp. SID4913]